MTTKMRPIRDTISIEAARRFLIDAAAPVDRVERIAIDHADGRVLASPVVSKIDVPPFDRAAMDGYAVMAQDTFGAGRHNPKILRSVDTIYTGAASSRRIAPGECVEIATGAPLPGGADAVVMVEETERADGADVRVFTPVYPGQHVGKRAGDVSAGQSVLAGGAVLNPSRIGVLAAIGTLEIDVYARPLVAILSTGNEIVDPGQPLAPGQIYDINRFTLSTIIHAHGGTVGAAATVPDTLADLRRAMASGAADDLIIFSGGSSVGERDLIVDVLQEAGEVIFHGIAVKPGKPTILGKVGGKPVVGMPGNPTSCLSNAHVLADSDAAQDGALAGVFSPDRHGRALAPHCLDHRAASDLYRSSGRRHRDSRVQRFERHHQHGPRRRLHRDSSADRHRRGWRSSGSKVVLMASQSPLRQAPLFELPNHKGEMRSMAQFLQGGAVLLAFHRGTW